VTVELVACVRQCFAVLLAINSMRVDQNGMTLMYACGQCGVRAIARINSDEATPVCERMHAAGRRRRQPMARFSSGRAESTIRADQRGFASALQCTEVNRCEAKARRMRVERGSGSRCGGDAMCDAYVAASSCRQVFSRECSMTRLLRRVLRLYECDLMVRLLLELGDALVEVTLKRGDLCNDEEKSTEQTERQVAPQQYDIRCMRHHRATSAQASARTRARSSPSVVRSIIRRRSSRAHSFLPLHVHASPIASAGIARRWCPRRTRRGATPRRRRSTPPRPRRGRDRRAAPSRR
jgi:hypothetical protein